MKYRGDFEHERSVMKKADNKINVRWEYIPAPDAAARLTAAFALLFEQPPLSQTGADQNLTENPAGGIMPHEES
jgi:hypothetical protein